MHVNGRLLGDYAIVKELDADGELMSELAAFRGMSRPGTSAGLDPNLAQRDVAVSAVAAWKRATQEAPGYLAHALDAWLADAPIYRQYFGFDPLTSPRLIHKLLVRMT